MMHTADIETLASASLQTTSEETVIEITNLRKGFGKQEVLKNISLKLFCEENLVVLGKSGSGKSVLIKCIARLLNPDEGTINVLGNEVSSMKRKELGEL